MPKRQQFFEDMAVDGRHAALLVAQAGGVPGELQLIIQVADHDEDKGYLQAVRTYIIRVLGVLEHAVVNLGMTEPEVRLLDQHPLLYVYRDDPAALFFRGQADNPSELALDIAQAHASTFGPWRHFPEYLNMDQPLNTLLRSGGGLLGQMPRTLADKLAPLLEHHGLEHRLMVGSRHEHDNPVLRQQLPEVLIIGDSYFVAYSFAFDEMGKI